LFFDIHGSTKDIKIAIYQEDSWSLKNTQFCYNFSHLVAQEFQLNNCNAMFMLIILETTFFYLNEIGKTCSLSTDKATKLLLISDLKRDVRNNEFTLNEKFRHKKRS